MKFDLDAFKLEIKKLQLKPGDILAVKVIPEIFSPLGNQRMGEIIQGLIPSGVKILIYGANEIEISEKPPQAANTVPFTEEDVKGYLDDCILSWREQRKKGNLFADNYIDAFQSVRSSLFGTVLGSKK